MNNGHFSEFAEAVLDFVRCERSDGSAYGIAPGKKCRKGVETAAQKLAKLPREKVAKLAQDPRLTPKQKALVNKALNGGVTPKPASKPKATAKPKTAKPPKETSKAPAKAAKPTKTAKPAKAESYEQLYAKGKELMAEYNKLVNAKKFDEADKKIKEAIKVNETLGKMVKSGKGPKEAASPKPTATKPAGQDEAKWKERQDARDAAQLKVNLNSRQKQAIKSYTDEDLESGYRQLNECMRIPRLCDDKKWAGQFARNLDGALNALPKNKEGDTFYRGVWAKNGPARELYYALENAKPGQKLKDPGFGSYTSRERTAKDFYSETSPSILFKSSSKRLTPINMYSELPSEYEALMPRGTSQTIRSVTKQGELLIIELD